MFSSCQSQHLWPHFTATVAKHLTTDVLNAASSVDQELKTQKCFERLKAAILKSPLSFGQISLPDIAMVTYDVSHRSQLTDGSQACSRNRAANSQYETDAVVDCSDSSFEIQFCHLVVHTGIT